MTYCLTNTLYFKKLFLFLGVIFSYTLLSSCSSQSDAAWKTIQMGFRNEAARIDKNPLKNNLSYLRANINGLDVLLVKGYVDFNINGQIDVWYSSDGSVMRIQQGRYLGSVGFDENWHEVSRNTPPDLGLVLKNETVPNSFNLFNTLKTVKKYFYTQSYISMPNYLVIRDERVSAVMSVSPPESLPTSFKSYLQGKELFWISETPQTNNVIKKKQVGLAWYGFTKKDGGFEQIIGQQCLSKEFCITWMPWPLSQ